MKIRLLALLALATLGMAACGGGDGGDGQACGDFVTTSSIEAGDNFFEPSCVTADSDELAIENTGEAVHTFTLEEGGIDEQIDVGDQVTVDVGGLEPGQYPFHCTFHGEMTGALTIE
jgi:plastocyanin